MKPARIRLTSAALLTLTLSGCATLGEDAGFAPVAQTTQARLGK